MQLHDSSVLTIPEKISLYVTPLSGSGSTLEIVEGRGVSANIGVRVSGAGAWARMQGTTSFNWRRLETSQEYNSLRREFGFSGGVRSFFRWIGGNVNVGGNSKRVTQTFTELRNEKNLRMEARFDLWVTGILPNFPVEASAFIRLLQVTMFEETYWVISDGNPREDTGAGDRNNNDLPDRDNDTIIIVI